VLVLGRTIEKCLLHDATGTAVQRVTQRRLAEGRCNLPPMRRQAVLKDGLHDMVPEGMAAKCSGFREQLVNKCHGAWVAGRVLGKRHKMRQP